MSGADAGLYLHVPFCARVCPYCDFAVRTGDSARRTRFAQDLCREIALYGSDDGLRFDTIYFGGGTPSRLAGEDLARILETARQHLELATPHWTFLEANPDDVTPMLLAHWRRLGVTTLSLGVQSLDPAALQFLGRTHDAGTARRAVELALAEGFDTVSIDLIYGLPDQTEDDWRRQLEAAVSLGCHHISCYQLTIHERTRFHLLEKRGRLTQLPVDKQGDLFRVTHRVLNDAGLAGYEVSQFAAAVEHRSRHNTKYWDHTPYLGLGPSAHSFRDRRRWWNLRKTDPWQEQVRRGARPVEESEDLDTEALLLEALMTGLRTYRGVDLSELRLRWGVDLLAPNRTLIETLVDEGLVDLVGTRLRPTLDGLALADSLAPRFRIGEPRSAG